MLPNQNETLVLLCVAVITASPFYFRTWVAKHCPQPAEVEKKVSHLTWVIFGALFLGAFLFSERSKASGEVLLAASILSFSFLYRTRWTHLSGAPAVKKASPRDFNFLKRKTITLIALTLLALLCAQFPLIAPALVLAYPFCSAHFLRWQHPCQPLAESPLRRDIQNIFGRAQVKLREIYLIDAENAQAANALMAQNTLFITLPLLEKLTENEILAVVCHEASHLQSKHALKRMIWAMAYLGLAIFWLALPLTLSFPGNIQVASSALVATVLLQIFFISRKIQQQEFEADQKAVHLGAGRPDLISALEKLRPTGRVAPHSILRLISGNFHPPLDQRIRALRPESSREVLSVLPKKQYWAAYSLMLVGLFFHSVATQTESPARAIASSPISSLSLER